MTRFVAVALVVAVDLLAPVAIAEQVGDRTAARCADSKDLAERARCERLAAGAGQGASVGDQTLCGRARECGEGRGNRTTRPRFWIGHHYSGL